MEKVYSDRNKSLDNINLGISQGEFIFLVGHSGAGKSTLLKILTREEKVSSGREMVLKLFLKLIIVITFLLAKY